MKLLGLLVAACAARRIYLAGGRRLSDALAYVAATRALALEQRGLPADRALDWSGGAPEVLA